MRERGVVVDLEHLAGRDLNLESFMASAVRRLGQDRGVKRHLGAGQVLLDVAVQALVVGGLAPTARDEHQRRREQRELPHVARAWSSVILPSYSALPRITASAPAAVTRRMWSTEATPPEYCR